MQKKESHKEMSCGAAKMPKGMEKKEKKHEAKSKKDKRK